MHVTIQCSCANKTTVNSFLFQRKSKCSCKNQYRVFSSQGEKIQGILSIRIETADEPFLSCDYGASIHQQ